MRVYVAVGDCSLSWLWEQLMNMYLHPQYPGFIWKATLNNKQLLVNTQFEACLVLVVHDVD